MNVLHDLVRRVERIEALDRLAKPLVRVVGPMVRPTAVRNLLSGTYVGHPLHPMLTDVPIGAWGMSVVLDAVGGAAAESAADLLVNVGVAAAAPTAASGLNDWSYTNGRETRAGLVHAMAMSTALSLYVASAAARARGSRQAGKALGLAGFAVLSAGGYLGGHLSFVLGVNVNRTAWQDGPREWTAVLADADLAEGEHRKVDAAGIPILLYRTAGRLCALASTCSHMGGPLAEGAVGDGCVTCPWHGSVFRFADGGIVRGPASTPQPRYEAQIRDGQIEVRVSP